MLLLTAGAHAASPTALTLTIQACADKGCTSWPSRAPVSGELRVEVRGPATDARVYVLALTGDGGCTPVYNLAVADRLANRLTAGTVRLPIATPLPWDTTWTAFYAYALTLPLLPDDESVLCEAALADQSFDALLTPYHTSGDDTWNDVFRRHDAHRGSSIHHRGSEPAYGRKVTTVELGHTRVGP